MRRRDATDQDLCPQRAPRTRPFHDAAAPARSVRSRRASRFPAMACLAQCACGDDDAGRIVHLDPRAAEFAAGRRLGAGLDGEMLPGHGGCRRIPHREADSRRLLLRLSRSASASRIPLRRMPPGDAAEHHAAREPMLGEAALRLACAIEAGNHLAARVEHFRIGVGAQPGERVVQDRRRPGGIEGRLPRSETSASAWRSRHRHRPERTSL